MFKIFVSVVFLSIGHFAPCFGDVVSFHRALANYSSHKHLGNLTSGDQMQHTWATWPSPSESILSYPRKCVLNLCFYPWDMLEHLAWSSFRVLQIIRADLLNWTCEILFGVQSI